MNNAELNRVSLQAIELEQVVLGSILIDKDSIYNVIDILTPESFYSESHQIIYGSIIDLCKKGSPVDLYSVTSDLREHNELDKIGGILCLHCGN